MAYINYIPPDGGSKKLAELYASGGWSAVRKLASADPDDICSIVWAKHLGQEFEPSFFPGARIRASYSGDSVSFSFVLSL